jgi:general secretion pathway protein J
MKRAGFTLVELLIALSIFALLAGGGVVLMRQTLDGHEIAARRLERAGELQRARALLQTDLSQIARRRTRGVDGTLSVDAFFGSETGQGTPLMAFVRRGWENVDGDARPSLQYVEYHVVEGRLERRYRPLLDGAALSAPQVVLTEADNLRLAYLNKEQWIANWRNALRDGQPRAVRLEASLPGLGQVRMEFLTPGLEP